MVVPEAFKLLIAGCKTYFIEGDAISELVRGHLTGKLELGWFSALQLQMSLDLARNEFFCSF